MDFVKKFVIGDIHGCYKTFKKLFYDTLKPEKTDEVYLLGDLIDRGPGIKQVVDEVMNLKSKGYKICSVRGNHEELLLESLFSFCDTHAWVSNGAYSTLKSFNITHPLQLEPEYLRFFRGMKYYYLTEDFVIVHAGLNCKIDNPFEDTFSMLWTRDEYVNRSLIGGRRVICGHTPTSQEKVRNSLNQDKIFLDGGCVYKGLHIPGGFLFALELNTMTLYEQYNVDW